MNDEPGPPAPSVAHVYRRDIDGLRAVAVLSVLLYHMHFAVARGGFVGVDIFFVISGYLIIGLIHKDIVAGQFSFIDFYERRIRRIFPALMAVFAACAISGLYLMFASELRELAASTLTATLFGSNYLFLATLDYFSTNGTFHPLLHTWSLGIEEQFYIFAPILLIVLARRRRPLDAWLWATFVVSLVISEWLARSRPQAAFYILPSRAWELLTGGLIAVGAVPPLRRGLTREIIAILGAAAIACSVIFYSDNNFPFPGLSALLPTVGAALIIHAGEGTPTLVSRLLSLPPVVFFGLISYSLYLWHWPILTFYQLQISWELSRTDKLLILAICVLAGWLSLKYIETPVRRLPRSAHNRRLVFTWGAASMTVMIAFSLAVLASGGLGSRFSPEVTRLAAMADDHNESPLRRGSCFLYSGLSYLKDYDRAACATPMPSKTNVLILGDSHAAHLWYGLAQAYPDVNFMQATAAGCPPIRAYESSGECSKFMRYVFDDFLTAVHPDAVILASRWTANDTDNIAATLLKLAPDTAHIFVIGPTAEYRSQLPRVLARAQLQGDPGLVDAARRADTPGMDLRLARQVASIPGVSYISIYDVECPQGRCKTLLDTGMPLQWDYGHLSAEGSVWLAEQLKSQKVLPW